MKNQGNIMETIATIGTDKAILQLLETIKAKDNYIAVLEAKVAQFEALQATLGKPTKAPRKVKETTTKGLTSTKLKQIVRKLTSKNSLAVLSTIKVQEGLATVTNLKATFEWQVPGIEDGLYEADKFIKGDKWVLSPLSIDKFPETLSLEKAVATLYKSTLERFGTFTSHVSDDETRYFMNGVYVDFQEGQLVATDGRRLAYGPASINAEVSLTENNVADCIIPPTHLGLEELADYALIYRNGKEKYVVKYLFDGASYQVHTIEGQFPNWKRVIPEQGKFSLTLPSLETLSQAKKLGDKSLACKMDVKGLSICTDTNKGVWLDIAEGDYLPNIDYIDANFDNQYYPQKGQYIKANVDYLIDAIKAGVETLYFSTFDKALVGLGCDGVRCVIMPMQH